MTLGFLHPHTHTHTHTHRTDYIERRQRRRQKRPRFRVVSPARAQGPKRIVEVGGSLRKHCRGSRGWLPQPLRIRAVIRWLHQSQPSPADKDALCDCRELRALPQIFVRTSPTKKRWRPGSCEVCGRPGNCVSGGIEPIGRKSAPEGANLKGVDAFMLSSCV